jgi:23S rRNA pseudouridine1911/1915/1917 synthase
MSDGPHPDIDDDPIEDEIDDAIEDAVEEQAVVEDAHDGRRLDVHVAALLSISRSAAAQRIDAGEVTVGGRPARRSRVLVTGEVVTIAAPPERTRGPAPTLPPVRYRDEHLVVLAKPPGLVVHPGAGHEDDTLVDALRAAGVPLAGGADPSRPGIVHRLDRDTSGLLVVASSQEAYDGLVAMLAERTVLRRYLTLVLGSPEDVRGVVDAPIARHPNQRRRFAIVDGGRPARTRYRVIGTGEVRTADGTPRAISALVCGLETGRTHQIRVHLDAVGMPVAGDPTYGAERGIALALGLERPALHAAHLSFLHPVTGATVSVTEPLPQDLVEAWARAGIDLPDGTEEP